MRRQIHRDRTAGFYSRDSRTGNNGNVKYERGGLHQFNIDLRFKILRDIQLAIGEIPSGVSTLQRAKVFAE
jgi:hypothetical protein